MQLLCSSSLCLHLVNSLIAPAPAVVSADEAFISVSAILAPADQIGSTETGYAIGGAGSTSTTGSAIGSSTASASICDETAVFWI